MLQLMEMARPSNLAAGSASQPIPGNSGSVTASAEPNVQAETYLPPRIRASVGENGTVFPDSTAEVAMSGSDGHKRSRSSVFVEDEKPVAVRKLSPLDLGPTPEVIKVYGPARPSVPRDDVSEFPSPAADSSAAELEKSITWVPPSNQAGDGTTHLNKKYGY